MDAPARVDAMDTQDITRRVLSQRMNRYPDAGPDLGAAGMARYRQEVGRLRVAFAKIRQGHARDAVARVQGYGRYRGAEVQWIVVPRRAGEEELPEALTEAGFTLLEDLLLMAHEGPIHPSPSRAITVTVIESPDVMWQYEYGSRQAFYDDEQPSEAMVSQRARDRWREQEHGWCRYYQATLGGRMVGGCYVSLFEEIPTILGVYTVPWARRRGVARALLTRTVGDLVRSGRWTCCLFVKHGNPAELLYRRLGFAGLTDERTYAWQPS